MTRQYFGTDGIRGTVGQKPITPDFILRLAHAVGRVLKRSEPRPTVLIGKDTRISGYMFESALEAGLSAAGVSAEQCARIEGPAGVAINAISAPEIALSIAGGMIRAFNHGLR